jgi:hypothetical protein
LIFFNDIFERALRALIPLVCVFLSYSLTNALNQIERERDGGRENWFLVLCVRIEDFMSIFLHLFTFQKQTNLK